MDWSVLSISTFVLTLEDLVCQKVFLPERVSVPLFKVPRVPVHTLAMVVPPQEPDRTPQENSPPLLGVVKGQYVATQRIYMVWKWIDWGPFY